MGQARTYTKGFKEQALKLAKKVGKKRAAEELGVPYNTLSRWVHKAKKGELDPGLGEQTPETALTLAAENEEFRKFPNGSMVALDSICSVYYLTNFCWIFKKHRKRHPIYPSLNFELCKCHRLTNLSNNRIVIIALKM